MKLCKSFHLYNVRAVLNSLSSSEFAYCSCIWIDTSLFKFYREIEKKVELLYEKNI